MRNTAPFSVEVVGHYRLSILSVTPKYPDKAGEKTVLMETMLHK